MFGRAYFGGAYYGPRYWGPAAGVAPPVVTSNQRRGFAGFPRSPLWLAHINGKRYVGTYDELERILGDVVEKTAKKPRIVIKPLRKAPEGASVSHEVAAPREEEAKQVQQQLYMDIQPLLLAVLARRLRDDDDDIETILMI